MSVASPIADALFSPVQLTVLALLFVDPTRSLRGSEVISRAGSGTGAVHRQLKRLVASGLVTATRVGNQLHYRANEKSPVFTEVRGLVVKTVGLVAPIAKALAPWAKAIESAFVFGSVAAGTAEPRSDIDLMVVADDVAYGELLDALQAVEGELGRAVDLRLIGAGELRLRLEEANPFFTKVFARPRIPVFGSDTGEH